MWRHTAVALVGKTNKEMMITQLLLIWLDSSKDFNDLNMIPTWDAQHQIITLPVIIILSFKIKVTVIRLEFPNYSAKHKMSTAKIFISCFFSSKPKQQKPNQYVIWFILLMSLKNICDLMQKAFFNTSSCQSRCQVSQSQRIYIALRYYLFCPSQVMNFKRTF